MCMRDCEKEHYFVHKVVGLESPIKSLNLLFIFFKFNNYRETIITFLRTQDAKRRVYKIFSFF